MTLLFWMTGASVGSWAIAALWLGLAPRLSSFLGMVGPLVVVGGTWVLAARTFQQRPERLTTVMATAFVAKMVFFGAYVAVAVVVFSSQPVPFVVSFVGYFITLHAVEAFALHRLFARGASPSR